MNMSVHVKLSTTLRLAVPAYDPVSGLIVDLPGQTTVRALAARIGLEEGAIKIIMVNGRHASFETSLKRGDRVAFFPAVGGG